MIKLATIEEVQIAAKMALLLWPSHSIEEFISDKKGYSSSEDTAIFGAFDKDEAIGFSEANKIICFTKNII